MFIFIGLFFTGIAVGYLLRHVKMLEHVGHSITWTLYVLLFLLGLSVGSNREIIQLFPSIGGQALLIAAAATLGSLIGARIVYHYLFEKGAKDER